MKTLLGSVILVILIGAGWYLLASPNFRSPLPAALVSASPCTGLACGGENSICNTAILSDGLKGCDCLGAGGECRQCDAVGGECAGDAECCNDLQCRGGSCKECSSSTTGGSCASNSECCRGETCEGGNCCKDAGASCTSDGVCCSGSCSPDGQCLAIFLDTQVEVE